MNPWTPQIGDWVETPIAPGRLAAYKPGKPDESERGKWTVQFARPQKVKDLKEVAFAEFYEEDIWPFMTHRPKE